MIDRRGKVKHYIAYHFPKVKHPDQLSGTLCEIAEAAGFDALTKITETKAWLDTSGNWHKYRNWSRFLHNQFRDHATRTTRVHQEDAAFEKMRRNFLKGAP